MDSTEASAGPPDQNLRDEFESLRAERDALVLRQKRLADVLNCPPEKIEHELRNVLNELRLLRTLFESQGKP